MDLVLHLNYIILTIQEVQGAQGDTGAQGIQGDTGSTGAGISPNFASLQSNTTQNTSISPTSVAITYDERTIGTINQGAIYPTSQIVIPITGTYKILFSAQCVSADQHYLEIFPTINSISVPKSNTRIRLTANVENCLTVEYFLSCNANDILQFYMTGDSTDARILTITGGGTPAIPDIPSIIVMIMQIA